MPDPMILQKARTERRILLTHDLDFGNLLAASGDRLPSVIIFRFPTMRPDIVNRYLLSIIAEFENVLESGAVISVSLRRIRSRRLPINGRTS